MEELLKSLTTEELETLKERIECRPKQQNEERKDEKRPTNPTNRMSQIIRLINEEYRLKNNLIAITKIVNDNYEQMDPELKKRGTKTEEELKELQKFQILKDKKVNLGNSIKKIHNQIEKLHQELCSHEAWYSFYSVDENGKKDKKGNPIPQTRYMCKCLTCGIVRIVDIEKIPTKTVISRDTPYQTAVKDYQKRILNKQK